jgi:hypothetical protein
MAPLPDMIIVVMAPFAALFAQRVWTCVRVLGTGVLLCRGRASW